MERNRRGIICPVCEILGKKSVSRSLGASSTAMGIRTFYDEEGVGHYHDGNIWTEEFQCANGHWFGQKRRHTCKNCDWIQDVDDKWYVYDGAGKYTPEEIAEKERNRL
jgi:rubredoxin